MENNDKKKSIYNIFIEYLLIDYWLKLQMENPWIWKTDFVFLKNFKKFLSYFNSQTERERDSERERHMNTYI